MFTLRPSDPHTVLLWGSRWHFPDREASEPFTHVTHAAELLAARFADEPKPVRLRLVFQPDSLESTLVACPQGDRRVLAFALAGEYPALAQPDHAWGHEPVLADAEGFSTILHYEKEPALIALATQLARLGLAVDSAWPLATFLHALPEEWTDSGGVTVAAVSSESGVAYLHPKGAARAVIGWRGSATLAEAGQWLAGIIHENPGEPVLLVCDSEETATALDSYIGEHEHTGLDVISAREALGRHVVMPRYHPAQLLPRQSGVTAQRAAIAASIALLFAAGWAGFAFGRDWRAVRTERDIRVARLAALQTETKHLRANADEIAKFRTMLEGGVGGPPYSALLRALSKTVPQEVALTSIRLEGKQIEVAGWTSPTAQPGLLEAWKQVLAQTSEAWSLEMRSSQSGAFVAAGAFRQ